MESLQIEEEFGLFNQNAYFQLFLEKLLHGRQILQLLVQHIALYDIMLLRLKITAD